MHDYRVNVRHSVIERLQLFASRMTLVIEELFLHIDLRKDMNTDIQEKKKK